MTSISLIIPLYNAKKYLRECLDSVLGQSFVDFECLCVDDGSVDGTSEIVKEYVSKDNRFRLISQVNAGCSVARNRGIIEAKGEFIAFLDQDDLLHPQAFEALHYLMEKYQTDVASFKFKHVAEDYKLNDVEQYDFAKVKAKMEDDLFKRFFSNKKGSQVEIWTRLYRRSLLLEHEICFPKDVQPAEDTIFTLKVMYHAKNMVSIMSKLMFYRDSLTSVMNEGKTENYVRSHINASSELYNYFIESGLLKGKDLKHITYYITRIIFKTCVSQVLRLVKDKSLRVTALNLVIPLYQRGIFNPKLLGVRYFFASKLFLAGKEKLAKMLL